MYFEGEEALPWFHIDMHKTEMEEKVYSWIKVKI